MTDDRRDSKSLLSFDGEISPTGSIVASIVKNQDSNFVFASQPTDLQKKLAKLVI